MLSTDPFFAANPHHDTAVPEGRAPLQKGNIIKGSAVAEDNSASARVYDLARGEARLEQVFSEILSQIRPYICASGGLNPQDHRFLHRNNEIDSVNALPFLVQKEAEHRDTNVPNLTSGQLHTTGLSGAVQGQMNTFERPSAHLVLATPGLGKTRSIQALIELLPPEAVVWVFQPTLRKSAEFARDMSGSSRPVHVFRGRGAPIAEGAPETMCVRAEVADKVAAQGFSIAKLLCGKSNLASDAACPFSPTCAYQSQLKAMKQHKGGGVFVMTHASLMQPPPLPDPNLVIIDEDPSASLPQTINVAAYSLCPGNDLIGLIEDDDDHRPLRSGLRAEAVFESDIELPEDAQEALAATLERLVIGLSASAPLREIASTIEVQELEASLKQVSALERKLRTAQSAGGSDETLRNTLKTTLMCDVSGARALLAAVLAEVRLFCAGTIERDAFNAVRIFTDADGALWFKVHRLAKVGIKPSVPLIVLDGTADPILLARALRRRMEVWKINVERKGEVVQCLGRSFSTASLVSNPGYPTAASNLLEQERLWNELTQVLRRERANTPGNRILVVSTLPVEEAARRRQDVAELLKKGLIWTHFGAVRGINSFTDIKTVVLIGRKQPPAAAVEAVARAYFATDPKPFDPETSDYVARRRTLHDKKGKAWSTLTQMHPDARVNRVLWQMRQAEVIQAIDRVRPARFSRRIVILNTLDLRRPDDPGCRRSGVPADAYLSWRELHNGGNRAETILSESGGFLPVAPRALAHMAPDLFPSVEAAKKWLHRTDLGEALARHIDHLTQMRVRPDGQRGAAWPMFVDRRRFECLASARVAFERMMGKRMAIWAPVD